MDETPISLWMREVKIPDSKIFSCISLLVQKSEERGDTDEDRRKDEGEEFIKWNRIWINGRSGRDSRFDDTELVWFMKGNKMKWRPEKTKQEIKQKIKQEKKIRFR